MNNKIKRIIAFVLAIGAFSAMEPAKNFNLITTKAYATEDISGISGLKICKSSGDTSIKMYKNAGYTSSTTFKTDIYKYYVRLSDSVSKFNIRASVDSGYSVKVIDQSDDDEEYDLEDEISIKKDETKTIKVEITKDSDSSKQTVTLKLYRKDDEETNSDTTEEDTYGDVYLDDVTLSNSGDNIKLGFKPETTTYNINVGLNIDRVKIEVNKDEDDDRVKINGTTVDEENDYKKIVMLSEGENKIEILVKNDDESRVYKINITRGESSTSTNISKSKWIMVNGKWQYNDSNGNVVKNMWIQNYFVQADGNMATGWLNYNGIWFYLGNDGAKKMGWQFVNGKWYYLDTTEGKMLTGWMKDIKDGKYYYLNSDGSMAYNTTINGYRLGSSGAWIK